MATIQQAIYYAVTNDGTVSPIIAARMFPAGDVPQDTDLEYLTYQRISSERVRHQGGDSNLRKVRVQIDSWGHTELEAWTLAAAVEGVLHDHSGLLGEGGSQVYCDLIVLEDERDDTIAPTSGGQRAPWRVSQDYIVWYRPS